MADSSGFSSQIDTVIEDIRDQVAQYIKCQPLCLPTADAPLVASFIKKTEGIYRVHGFKGDLKQAIDVMFIACNATPHSQDAIRKNITANIDKLIVAQQQSESAIRETAKVAVQIHRRLEAGLTDWLRVRESDQRAEVTAFLGGTMFKLGEEIAEQAAQVSKHLQNITDGYRLIQSETVLVYGESEIALGDAVKADPTFATEWGNAGAHRIELDQRVARLRKEVKRYEEWAGASALSTSELVELGMQWVSVMLPLPALRQAADISCLAASRFCNFSRAGASNSGNGNTSSDVGQGRQDEAKSALRQHIALLEIVKIYEEVLEAQEEELAELKSGLIGQCRAGQSTELAIVAFNLSLGALARCKEIVEQLEFFFAEFAKFMLTMVKDAQTQAEHYEQFADTPVVGNNRLEHLLKKTDELFIEQAGQWLAVEKMANLFAGTFKQGWNRLNDLSSVYITKKEICLFLDEAAQELASITEERKRVRTSRSAELQGCLTTLRNDLAEL